jgi:DeoR family transcriptional regulator, suf operon transcriptional repressor
MQDERFFHSPRGKIVAALRRRHSASAVDLAAEFGLSTNAVRQQLMALERDGYVAERPVRRGPTKPTLEYSLTESGEALFPQQYDKMLNAVLREVKDKLGREALNAVLEGLGKRAAERLRFRLDGNDAKGRVVEVAAMLRENGVEADVVETPRGVELREHNCPYARTVSEYPEVCNIIHTVLHEAVPGDVRQVESIATGGETCRFEVQHETAAGSSAT